MFLGTDDGLYYSLDAAENWTKFDSNVFPTVSTKDLVSHPRENDLVIGTFGRAAWILDDIRPLRAIAKNPELVSKESHIFEPPTAYLASYQQPSGSRFGGDALYNALRDKEGDAVTLEIFDPNEIIRGVVESISYPVQSNTEVGSVVQYAILTVRGTRQNVVTDVTSAEVFGINALGFMKFGA